MKKAYKKSSLVYHPDRVLENDKKEEAKSKFQILSRVHLILTDKEKRTVYDETGNVKCKYFDCLFNYYFFFFFFSEYIIFYHF